MWTPTGNPSLKASQRIPEIFPSRTGVIVALAEIKQPESDNSILTSKCVSELLQFHNIMLTHSTALHDHNEGLEKVSYSDICIKMSQRGSHSKHCLHPKSLLSFSIN